MRDEYLDIHNRREDVRNLILVYPSLTNNFFLTFLGEIHRVNPEILGYPRIPGSPLTTSLVSSALKYYVVVCVYITLSQYKQKDFGFHIFFQTRSNSFKLVQTRSNSFKLIQTCSMLFKLAQTHSNSFNVVQTCSASITMKNIVDKHFQIV